MMTRLARVLTLGVWLGVSLIVAPRSASAGFLGEAGLGAGSAVATFVYAPLKISYALVGGVIGSLGFIFSVGSSDVAKKIWIPALGGTYVITPEMLKGEDVVRFFGTTTQTISPADDGLAPSDF